jgi:predicted TIM-barrel fold metal-dependent hydrolase
MSDRYLVISSDCHAGLPNEEYRPYLDPQHRAAFDDFLAEREAVRQSFQIMGNKQFEEEWFSENEEGLRGSWDATRRDKELDADGVVGEVIFPDADAVLGGNSAPFGAGLGMSSQTDPELLMAGARAHNRWLAELCAGSPERRAGVALVPIHHDVDAAVTEIRRAHASGLRGGLLIASMWNESPPYHDRRYDPVWAVCDELSMPVHTHSGAAPRDDYGTGPGFVGMYTTEVRWWATRPLWFLMFSGAFERFPGLRFAVTECGAFWAADLLWMMDMVFDGDHGTKKLNPEVRSGLKMRPSEYFDRQCGIGAANTRRRELVRRHEIGVGNIMWGNDFPHPEGTWPHTREFLRGAFWDIPVDETATMLGLAAADFYGFDLDRLRPLADRIGPTPEDLGQTDPSAHAKWADVAAAGRPWVTGREAVPVPARSATVY